MIATVEDGRVVKLRPDPDHPLSRATPAPRASRCSTCRTTPTGSRTRCAGAPTGASSACRWDDGARRHRRAPAGDPRPPRPGGARLVHGQPGRVLVLAHAVGQGLPRRLGTPHYWTASSQDVANRFAASALLYGSPVVIPIPDLQRTDFLLMLGANPLVSHGSVLTAPRVARPARRDRRPRRARDRGRPAAHRDRARVRARGRAPGRRRLAAALAAARALRRGPRRRGGARPRDHRRRRPARGRCRSTRPRRTEERTGVPAEDVRGARPRPRRRPLGRGLRPHRLVPGPLRHAGRLPASTRSTPSPATWTAPAAPCSGARRSRSTMWPSRPAWTPTGPSARASATSPT